VTSIPQRTGNRARRRRRVAALAAAAGAPGVVGGVAAVDLYMCLVTVVLVEQDPESRGGFPAGMPVNDIFRLHLAIDDPESPIDISNLGVLARSPGGDTVAVRAEERDEDDGATRLVLMASEPEVGPSGGTSLTIIASIPEESRVYLMVTEAAPAALLDLVATDVEVSYGMLMPDDTVEPLGTATLGHSQPYVELVID